MKSSTKTKILCFGGSALILLVIGFISYELYLHGLENKVYANNISTSIFFSDTLATAGTAAPWALFSLNFFICRSLIKKWWRFAKKNYLEK
ncbi:MAG: hypothetical protein WC846_04700 [Candidatus Gracilibacteria bacterium]|jgi:uncharacterized membrane protein YjfL (UPF0719 family)